MESVVYSTVLSKCTAKQMCFESGFECSYCWSTSDLFWTLVANKCGIIAKSRFPLFSVNPWYLCVYTQRGATETD